MKKDTSLLSKPRKRKKLRETSEGQEITKLLSDSIVDSIIDYEIDELISKILTDLTTIKALDLQCEKKVIKENSGYETDIDESEPTVDPFRKETLKQWNSIKERYEWRWNWLTLKIQDLENNLDEINEKLEEKLSEKVNSKVINLEEYPPQQRREDIINHPLFSYQQKITFQNEKISKGDMMNSFNIFTKSYTTKKETIERKTKKDKKKKKPIEYDINDVVIPWGDIRSNVVIPELKVKEIHTPKWRTPQDLLKEFNISDEDTSDEKFCNLHFPLEVDERKRYLIKQTKIQKEKDLVNGQQIDNSVLLEKLNRSWTQVTKESYTKEQIIDPTKGNWETLPIYEKRIEEKPKIQEIVKRKKRTIYYEEDYADENLVIVEDDDEYKGESSSDFDISEERKRKKRRRKKKFFLLV